MNEKLKAKYENMLIEVLLEFAPLYQELTTSDLQGIAVIKAREYLNLIEEETK